MVILSIMVILRVVVILSFAKNLSYCARHCPITSCPIPCVMPGS